jgi:hypothetical protein
LTEERRVATVPRSQNRATEDKECRYSPLFLRKKAWLPWQSNGQEHGFKSHRVTGGGFVEVANDNPQQRRKIKGVSSRQWERC